MAKIKRGDLILSSTENIIQGGYVVLDSTRKGAFNSLNLDSTGTNISEFSTDITLAGNSDTALPTEKAVKTYVDNGLSGIPQNKISQLNSKVEVIDTGTGRIEVTADDVLCAYMRAQEQAFYSGGVNALTVSIGGGVHYSYFGDGATFFVIEGDSGGGGYTNLYSPIDGAAITIAGDNASGVRKSMIVSDPDTSVDLYYAGVKKLETTSTGAKVTGDLETTNNVVVYGVRGVGNSALDLIAGSDGRRRVQITGDNYIYLSQSGENAVKNASFEIYRNDVPDVPVARFRGSSLSGRAPGVQIYAGGGAGDSVLDVRKGDATTQLFKVDGAGNAQVTGDLSVTGNTTITGNLTVDGTSFVANTVTVLIEDNLLVINKNETGAGVTAGVAGIEVERGSVTNYQFLFDEPQDNFRIGMVGSLQAVATREDTPNANGLAIWNSSSVRFDTTSNLVYSGGKLGVGTGSPNSLLHLYTTSANAAKIILQDESTAGGRGGQIYGSYGGNGIYIDSLVDDGHIYLGSTTNTDHIHMSTNGTERVSITSDGKVGIGTTSPAHNLNIVAGGNNTATRVFVDNYCAVNGYASGMRFRASNSNTVGTLAATVDNMYLSEIDFLGVDSNNSAFRQSAWLDIIQDGASGSTWVPSRWQFGVTKASDGTQSYAMTIKNTGNIGIGTVSPSAKLSINGGLHVGGDTDPGDDNLLVDGIIKLTGTTKTDGYLYAGTSDPTNSTRLNYDGYFYATRVYNAVWNDVADFQKIIGEQIPGKCYYGTFSGLSLCFVKCQKAVAGILSDTFGLAAGYQFDDSYGPIAIAGWVLAYVDDICEPGDVLTNGSNGNLVKMSKEEKLEYPERIVAIYGRPESSTVWGTDSVQVQVNGRHWVQVK